MKEILKFAFLLSVTIFMLASCNNNAAKDNNIADKVSKVTLTEKQIGESGFYISIPADYSITTSNGPDFSVYYFSPTDTTVKNKLSGGLYFGNFPHEFEADNVSCKIETLKGNILDRLQDWTVYNCQGDYSIQTIADNKKSEGWNQRIHAFGQAYNKDDLHTILGIYSTLRKNSDIKKGSH